MEEADLRTLLAEQHAEIRAVLARIAPAPSAVVVGELWPAYELAEKTRLKSWRSSAQRWRDHVGPFFGERQAAVLTPDDVDAYRARRLEAGAKMGTVNREIALLRRILSWAARRKRISFSPLHGSRMTAELIHAERNTRTTIVQERPTASGITLAAFLEAANARLRTFLVLLLHTGMRRGEAAALRWERIDFAAGVAWVPALETKGDAGGRTVPISAEALALLRELPRIEGNPFVFASRRRPRGRHEHKDVWTHRFGRLARKLGIEGPDGPPWLHDLRRSFITLSRRRGESESSIMEISGHKTRAAFDRYDVHDLGDVVRFRQRMQAARAAELAEDRKPPHRAKSSPADRPFAARA